MMSHCTMRTRLRKISCLSVYSVKALLKLSLMTEIGLVTLPLLIGIVVFRAWRYYDRANQCVLIANRFSYSSR